MGYKLRLRLDIEGSYSVWSDERTMMPGDREDFVLYWHPNGEKKAKAKLRAYFGNEILESPWKEVMFFETNTTDSFKVGSTRNTEQMVEFELNGPEGKAIIVPINYPAGWIFEEKKTVLGQSYTKISVPYVPAIWSPATITFAIFSENGKDYTTEQINLGKEENLDIVGRLAKLLNILRSHF